MVLRSRQSYKEQKCEQGENEDTSSIGQCKMTLILIPEHEQKRAAAGGGEDGILSHANTKKLQRTCVQRMSAASYSIMYHRRDDDAQVMTQYCYTLYLVPMMRV
jgi:hypothetical protein